MRNVVIHTIRGCSPRQLEHAQHRQTLRIRRTSDAAHAQDQGREEKDMQQMLTVGGGRLTKAQAL